MDLEKENDIRKLVRLIDPGDKNIGWLKDLFREISQVKEQERDRFLNEMNVDVVAALYYPIYDKYFTHQEIKELIGFYSSGIGIKIARNKSKNFSSQFTQNELREIEKFKRTGTGRKYNKLLSEIAHQHVESVKKYIDSLK